MANKFNPVAGQPFDPLEAERAGIFVRDAMDAHPGFSEGAKRIFNKQYAIAAYSDREKTPWLGFVFMKVETLSTMLAKSKPEVKRDLKELRTGNILGVTRPNRQESNRYCFIWQQWMSEGSGVISQNGALRAQPRSLRKNPEGSKLTGLRDQNRPSEGSTLIPLSKEELRINPTVTPTTTAAIGDWTPERIEEARELMRKYRGVRFVPDMETTLVVIKHMTDLADLESWLETLRGIKFKTQWGLHREKAPDWPARRADIQQQLERERIAQQAAEQEAIVVQEQCEAESTESLDVATIPAKPMTIAPAPEICDRCGSDGVVNGVKPAIWCDCCRGQQMRHAKPNYVNELNRSAAKYGSTWLSEKAS